MSPSGRSRRAPGADMGVPSAVTGVVGGGISSTALNASYRASRSATVNDGMVSGPPRTIRYGFPDLWVRPADGAQTNHPPCPRVSNSTSRPCCATVLGRAASSVFPSAGPSDTRNGKCRPPDGLSSTQPDTSRCHRCSTPSRSAASLTFGSSSLARPSASTISSPPDATPAKMPIPSARPVRTCAMTCCTVSRGISPVAILPQPYPC